MKKALLAVALVGMTCLPCDAAVSFFVSSGTNPNGDLGWQAAVGSFTEFDLDGFADGALVQMLTDGSTVVSVGPGAAGEVIFVGSFGGAAGGVYGTVFDRALLSSGRTLTLEFSQPVSGFGLWVFDDGSCCPDSFTMTVTEVGGATTTSAILDASPGSSSHTVEGFVGATSTVGIVSLVITNSGASGFEVDHLQLAAAMGACCSDGPGTESECLSTTESDCQANHSLYLGDGSICMSDIDCVALSVTFDSLTAVAVPGGVLVRWVTASEVDTIGFRLLRETSGSREKTLDVVFDLIPAAGHGLAGASYEVLDDSRQARFAVNYYLEEIDTFGKVTLHGPIAVDRGGRQRAVPQVVRRTPQR